MSTGSLFNTKRISRADFITYSQHVYDILDKNNIEHFSPLYYDDKETFGDLDIIVKKPFGEKEIFNLFNIPEKHYKPNGHVHSICYKNFQIDFITTKPNKFEITNEYYAWADVSIIIGRLFKKMNLTFGWEGLTYIHETKIGSHYREIGNIFISDKMKDILNLLGLDYSTYQNGFKTKNDIFDYISTSKYFHPSFFMSQKSSSDRRNKLLDNLFQYTHKNEYNLVKFNDEKIEFIIDSNFKEIKFKEKLHDIKEKEKVVSTNSEKFNGDIVMTITGLKNKELGDFIRKFKNYIQDSYNFKDFNDYVFNTHESSIIRDIKILYSELY